jgi:hypothetical protein
MTAMPPPRRPGRPGLTRATTSPRYSDSENSFNLVTRLPSKKNDWPRLPSTTRSQGATHTRLMASAEHGPMMKEWTSPAVQLRDATPPESDAHAGRWQPVLRREGPTFWKRQIQPDPDAPSQFSGVEPRGSRRIQAGHSAPTPADIQKAPKS